MVGLKSVETVTQGTGPYPAASWSDSRGVQIRLWLWKDPGVRMADWMVRPEHPGRVAVQAARSSLSMTRGRASFYDLPLLSRRTFLLDHQGPAPWFQETCNVVCVPTFFSLKQLYARRNVRVEEASVSR